MKTTIPCTLRPETIAEIEKTFDLAFERNTDDDGANVRGVWEATFEGDKIVLFVGAFACGEFCVATSEIDTRQADGEAEVDEVIKATIIETEAGILVNFGEENYPLEDGLLDDWAREALSEVESEAARAAESNAGGGGSYRSIRYDRDFM